MVILRPEKPRSPLIAVIGMSGERITARFPERCEAFRAACLRLDYHWNSPGGPWSRELDERWNGPTLDRLVELAHTLLSAGFIIELPDASLVERVVAGEFAPEQRRWVRGLATGAAFVIRWGRDDDFYARASRLPGARYEAGTILCPPEAWREVLDFADAHGFSLSERAREIAEAARARYEAAVLVVPAPRKAAPPPPPPPTTAVGVHPDLLDDDDGDLVNNH